MFRNMKCFALFMNVELAFHLNDQLLLIGNASARSKTLTLKHLVV